MKKYRIIISLVLVITLLALTGCTNIFESKPVTKPSEEVNTDEQDGWGDLTEYEVKKYEVEDGAFEDAGELNLYKYDNLADAEKVIDVLNDYFEINFTVDESTQHENGYGNWFWDNDDQSNMKSAAVSLSSVTGKFSFYYAPGSEAVASAVAKDEADEETLDKKVKEFVGKFEFVTGELELESSSPYNDLYYPYIAEGESDSQDVQVKGRRYLFVSPDYSKQRVEAQEGMSCYVECGNSDITVRDTQYFVVTVFNDGTIISVDNNITKADIVNNGTQKMIDESKMDELLTFFTSDTEDDTLVLKRAYVCSYNNYFGYPEIGPVIKVEFYFKSAPGDVQATEIALEGFYD